MQLIPKKNRIAIQWFDARLNSVIDEIENHFTKFRISDALMCLYKLVFDDFGPWYLEMVKPDYQKPVDVETFDKSVYFLESILKLLHPFMPFITEEIWQQSRKRDQSIMITEYPEPKDIDQDILSAAAAAFELISLIRNTRSTNDIPQKKGIESIC